MTNYSLVATNRLLKIIIATNLLVSELENCYGNQMRSRLRQMFNLIKFRSDVRYNRQIEHSGTKYNLKY